MIIPQAEIHRAEYAHRMHMISSPPDIPSGEKLCIHMEDRLTCVGKITRRTCVEGKCDTASRHPGGMALARLWEGVIVRPACQGQAARTV